MDYSKPHTLEEWIKFYEDKTQDKFECPKGFNFLWMPYRGFTVFKPDREGGIFLIYLTCGDGHFWYDVCEIFCKDELGRDVVITHRGVDEKTGIPTYYVTKYLVQGDAPAI